jgi:hypothetical protein
MYKLPIILLLSLAKVSLGYADCNYDLKEVKENDQQQLEVNNFRFENEFKKKCKVLVIYSKNRSPIKWTIAETNIKGEFKQISIIDAHDILSEELKETIIDDVKVIELAKSKLNSQAGADTGIVDECAEIKFELWSVGIGIGGTWGDGQFTIGTSPNEQIYYFTASGFSLAEVGVARFNTYGEICGINNENEISNFSGIYSGGGFGVALLPGYGIWSLVNQNGVSITLNSSFHGIFVGLPLKSLFLELK